MSHGVVKTFLKQAVNNLHGMCLIERAKKSSNTLEISFLKDEASRLIFPEKNLVDNKLWEWKADMESKESNISDRDYFKTVE